MYFAITQILSSSLSLPIIRNSFCQEDSDKDLSSSPEVIPWSLALAMVKDKHSISEVFMLHATVPCLLSVGLEVLLDSIQMPKRWVLILKHGLGRKNQKTFLSNPHFCSP